MIDLSEIDDWPVDNVAAAAVHADSVSTRGDINHRFPLASITKLITSLAVLVAHEEGTTSLDSVITESGATVADLLAHAAGIAPDDPQQIAPPRTRRSYSTAAYDLLAEHVALASGMPFFEYVREAVLQPAGMESTELVGSAGSGAIGSVSDMTRLAACWHEPIVVGTRTLALAASAHLPELSGVLPGFGRQQPNPWGLGPEIKGTKSPHWTGSLNSAATFGHFGRSGTMLWIDPASHTVVVALSDRAFGPWAAEAWPILSDSVIRDL